MSNDNQAAGFFSIDRGAFRCAAAGGLNFANSDVGVSFWAGTRVGEGRRKNFGENFEKFREFIKKDAPAICAEVKKREH